MAEQTNTYVVSARKYRPQTFKSVVGQQHITSTLQNAIKSNQLAQAFLFCGPRGVGKTTLARILAKTINCTNITAEVEACNECDSCRSFNDSGSLNIIELDAASNNSVEDIRELVNQINVPPMNGKYKVYIIDEVHMLSTAAFNAFLKTLEEPPKYAKFILATTEKQKILPTILSRCQIFDFHRITIKDISSHLDSIAKQEGVTAELEALDLIAQKADGGLRDALSMFDLMVSFTRGNLTYKSVIDSLNILDYDYFFRFVDYMLKGDLSSSLLLFDEVLQRGFQGDIFIDGLSNHVRNLLVCKDVKTVTLLNVADSTRQRYLDQQNIAPLRFLLNALSIANTSAMEYKGSMNKRLCVELMLMKMCNLTGKLVPPNTAPTTPNTTPTNTSTPTNTTPNTQTPTNTTPNTTTTTTPNNTTAQKKTL
jgi:DNA polymerase III subunit gamma/tau